MSEAEKRSEVLHIRVSPIERAQIEAKADEVGLVMSEYLRGVALKPKLRVTQRKSLDIASMQLLNAVGVNINQIAKALNSRQAYVPAELVECCRKLDAIYSIILADVEENW